MTEERSFWVVSPNVRNHRGTVQVWKRASITAHAAFMGWWPDETGHGGIGYRFAHTVVPRDIIMIARRLSGAPDLVGIGVVTGGFERRLKGFKPPEEFGSLRRLSPFVAVDRAPRRIRIIGALGHNMALRKLHPEWDLAHRVICDWMLGALHIKQGVSDKTDPYVSLPVGKEGKQRKLQITLLKRERNPALIRAAKDYFMKTHSGRIYCQACGFDFEKRYGQRGEYFIECHHKKPVSSYKRRRTTTYNDLIMLCSNCHSMVHREQPWLSFRQLRGIVKSPM